MPKLSCLGLSTNKVHPLDEETMAVMHSWSQLESLDLGGNNLDAAAIQHLVNANWPQLQTLDLDSCQLDADAIQELAKGQWPLLQDLILSGNSPTPKFLSNLSQAVWPMLSMLCLSFSPLCEDCIGELVSLKLPGLKRLHLFGTCLLSANF